jgi:hypothetical protein
MEFTKIYLENLLREFGHEFCLLTGNYLQIKGDRDNCLCGIQDEGKSVSVTFRNKIHTIKSEEAFIELLSKIE